MATGVYSQSFPRTDLSGGRLVFYTIFIEDKQERAQFAAKIKALIGEVTTYTPARKSVDIGIKADVDKQTLAKIFSLLERSGHRINAKSSEPPELLAYHANDRSHLTQKTGEIN